MHWDKISLNFCTDEKRKILVIKKKTLLLRTPRGTFGHLVMSVLATMFLSFCFHSCCLITVHVLFWPYLSFSLSHRLVTILIVSIAMSPLSLRPWLFLSSHHHSHCLVTNLATLTVYCPCENQTRTTPNHNVPFQLRFGTCSMFWNGPWTPIKCVPQGERLFR